MSELVYPWKRFWCTRESDVAVDDHGYLLDPDSRLGRLRNPDMVPLDQMTEAPCLVLLGEPGIGKSTVIKGECQRIAAQSESTGDLLLLLDLAGYQTDIRLCQEVFQGPVFQAWLAGTSRLHLFLDGLDEGILRIPVLAALLVQELQKCPVDRLFLRIICRSAEWPIMLEKGLRELWKDAVQVWQMAPLRRVDVFEAARAEGLDGEAFLRDVERLGGVPLAVMPVTLRFLLNTYRRSATLPSSARELYIEGCRQLCGPSDRRRESHLAGNLSADQRLRVAARIAALTVFGNRYAIWAGADRGDVPEEDITVQHLCGGKEGVEGDQFEVTEAAIRETLGTGLFRSRGANRVGWAHQTYPEFLAAWYLVYREATPAQMVSLLAHPAESARKLVPQLYETSAWLATMMPEIMRDIIAAEPEVLLRRSMAGGDVTIRSGLADALLKSFEQGKLIDSDWAMRERYHILAHPGLDKQLRPYICDDAQGIVARRAAIHIAAACSLSALQSDLAAVALEPSEPHTLRVNAAYAVLRVGDDSTKAMLKPLAYGEANDDPDDDLKGCGLLALWPGQMAAEEVFSVISPPKKPDRGGLYDQFLTRGLMSGLAPSHLVAALQWVERQQTPRLSLRPAFQILMDDIMLEASMHLGVAGVLDAFTRAALSRRMLYDEIVGDRGDTRFTVTLDRDDSKRRQVLAAMLRLLSGLEEDALECAGFALPLVRDCDLPWLIERLATADPGSAQLVLVKLIRLGVNWRERSRLDAMYDASQGNRILADEFDSALGSIHLDSSAAARMRAEHQRKREREQRNREPRRVEPPPAQRIAQRLRELDDGNLAAWPILNLDMTLDPDGVRHAHKLEPDLTSLPGWRISDGDTRKRIVEAAARYVQEGDPETHEWLGKRVFHWPAYAGYRALRLLAQEAPELVAAMSAEIWEKWAPIIVAYATPSGANQGDADKLLLSTAYSHAPGEIIRSLIAVIEAENEWPGSVYAVERIEPCWDERIAQALLDKAGDGSLKPGSLECVLGVLLRHRVAEAVALGGRLVPTPPPADEERRARAAAAARALMTYGGGCAWAVVWDAIVQDAQFGRRVIPDVARAWDVRLGTGISHLREQQLAELYVWLARQYPYDQDPQHEGVYRHGVVDDAVELRDSVLAYLRGLGTPEARDAVRWIAGELPELGWLKWTLREAELITRRQTWVPPSARDILRLTSESGACLVRDGDDLLEVLGESLRRMECKLQGETPAVEFLWDKCGADRYRPKDESSFANWAKLHLDDDLKKRGVIVNREVEISRSTGPGSGERTDIHVDAVLSGTGGEVLDPVTVIIEAKGCWNRDVDQAMETQLVDRYLKDSRCQHGLYLVGWFRCDRWDDGDSRKHRTPKLSITDAQAKFDAQAASLSQEEIRVKAVVVNAALR